MTLKTVEKIRYHKTTKNEQQIIPSFFLSFILRIAGNRAGGSLRTSSPPPMDTRNANWATALVIQYTSYESETATSEYFIII